MSEIHSVLGTRGSLIKFLPFLKALKDREVRCSYIDTGQHSASMNHFREVLGLRKPDFCLYKSDENVKKIVPAFFWFFRALFKGIFNIKKVFPDKSGVCVVHADNLTALIGAILAKYARITLIHWEAGERTSTLFKPFPEEFLRRLIDRMADVNITMSDIAYENLLREDLRAELHNVGCSGALDSLRTALELTKEVPDLPEKFVVVTVHRIETIYDKNRLAVVVNTVHKVSERIPVLWIVHENTKNQLKTFGYWAELKGNKEIDLCPLMDYVSFVNTLNCAEFVVTDGGGLQDETYFLGVPCLLMMDETGKDPHPNLCISKFDEGIIENFIDNYTDFKISSQLSLDISPADKLCDIVLDSLN